MIGCDRTAAFTGVNDGAVCQLEETLDHPLQSAICMLQCNEFYLRLVFTTIDGTTTSPSSFYEPISRSLVGCVSEWGIAPFEKIDNSDFPHLSNDALTRLSSDRLYAYKVCQYVISAKTNHDIALLEVGVYVFCLLQEKSLK